MANGSNDDIAGSSTKIGGIVAGHGTRIDRIEGQVDRLDGRLFRLEEELSRLSKLGADLLEQLHKITS
jgi:hypothetical protein